MGLGSYNPSRRALLWCNDLRARLGPRLACRYSFPPQTLDPECQVAAFSMPRAPRPASQQGWNPGNKCNASPKPPRENQGRSAGHDLMDGERQTGFNRGAIWISWSQGRISQS